MSSTANVRLESFLFTEQAFRVVRDHLAPDGVFVLYNYYREAWLVSKIATMLDDAFGTPPLVRTYSDVQAALADGPAGGGARRRPAARRHGRRRADRRASRPRRRPPTTGRSCTCAPRSSRRYYLVALGFVFVLALLAVGFAAADTTGTTIRRFSPHFFVLGTAFLLLETRSLVSFSLLFGTTWLVNALAFFAILVQRPAGDPHQRPLAPSGGRACSTRPCSWRSRSPSSSRPSRSCIDPPWLRYLLAAVARLRAGLLRQPRLQPTRSATPRTADMAFASNLLGAMVGGALEYVALITGYQALLLVRGGAVRPGLALRQPLALPARTWTSAGEAPASVPAGGGVTGAAAP